MAYGDEIRNLHRSAKLKLKLEHASDADAVAAAALRLVQRRIGACIPFGTAFARMPTGHSDRQRDPLDGLGMAAHNERAGREELAQAGRDPGRVVRAGPRQQEPELVAAHTGDQAVAPDIGEEDLAYNAQDLVADVVPAGVVDALEVIDIGHHEMRG